MNVHQKLYQNKLVTNFVNDKTVSKAVKTLCKPGAFVPVVLLETTVTSGRTYQAYQRDGKIEARERLFDETLTGLFWLFGLDTLYKIGDRIAKTFNKNIDTTIDTGKDHIRDPFIYQTRKTPDLRKKVASAKFAKLTIGSAIGLFIMGNVIPRIKNKFTENYKKQHKEDPLSIDKKHVFTGRFSKPLNIQRLDIDDYLNKSKNKKVSFEGSPASFFNKASHSLETNRISQLLTLDTGLLAGRSINARNKYDRDEIIFRDVSSSFFYVASTPLIMMGLTKLDKYKGANTDLDIEAVQYLSNKFSGWVGDKGMSVEEFDNKAFGTTDLNLLNEFKKPRINKAGASKEPLINKGYVTLDEFKEVISDENYRQKAQKIAKLQPAKFLDGKHQLILTPEQLEDSLNTGGALHEYTTLKEALSKATDGKAFKTDKFVSEKTISKIRKDIVNYTKNLGEQANKYNNGMITKDLIQAAKNRNLVVKFGHFLAGFGVSALFLSTLIPKMQYYITAKRTGKNEFPGIAKYNNN